MSSISRPYVIPVLAALLCAGVGTAFAQSNTLTIDQRGTANSLTVDQSRAIGGTVRGTGSGLLTGGPRAASALPPALQIGDGNIASIVDAGIGNQVVLTQQSSGGGNQASVGLGSSASEALASVIQDGSSNLASVNITGELNRGSILQDGSANNAAVTVSGAGSSGAVEQVGNGNLIGLTVEGVGTNVVFRQVGNGLTAGLPDADAGGAIVPSQGGVVVFSNATNVSITQSGFAAP